MLPRVARLLNYTEAPNPVAGLGAGAIGEPGPGANRRLPHAENLYARARWTFTQGIGLGSPCALAIVERGRHVLAIVRAQTILQVDDVGLAGRLPLARLLPRKVLRLVRNEDRVCSDKSLAVYVFVLSNEVNVRRARYAKAFAEVERIVPRHHVDGAGKHDESLCLGSRNGVIARLA